MKNNKFLFSIFFAFLAFNVAQADDRSSTETRGAIQYNQPSTGSYVDDTAITAKIKSVFLADKDIKSLSISVKTNDGIVTLDGEVNSTLEKEKAINLTKQVNGVKDVIDQIKIKSN